MDVNVLVDNLASCNLRGRRESTRKLACYTLGVLCIWILVTVAVAETDDNMTLYSQSTRHDVMKEQGFAESLSSVEANGRSEEEFDDEDGDSRAPRAAAAHAIKRSAPRMSKSVPRAASAGSLGSQIMSAASPEFDASTVQPMLQREADLRIVTSKDLRSLTEQISSAVDSVGEAYVEKSNVQGNEWHGYVTMTLRVPVQHFFSMLSTLQGLVDKREISSLAESVVDVTSEFVDAAARAASLGATHKQLLALMERANDVDSVLRVQGELSRVAQQLESQEARKKSLAKAAALSTIRLHLQQTAPQPLRPSRWNVTKTFWRAVACLDNVAASIVNVVVFVLTVAVPMAAIAALVWACFRSRMQSCAAQVQQAAAAGLGSVADDHTQ